jgi:hypothetical protein
MMGDEFSQEIYVGHLLKKLPADSDPEQARMAESEQDHQELQSIVNSLVKLPEETAPPKPVKVTRITHNQISAMRVTQSNMPAAKIEPQAKHSTLIQTFDALLGWFRPQEKRSRCLNEGHECKHCGQIIKTEAAAPEGSRGH